MFWEQKRFTILTVISVVLTSEYVSIGRRNMLVELTRKFIGYLLILGVLTTQDSIQYEMA